MYIFCPFTPTEVVMQQAVCGAVWSTGRLCGAQVGGSDWATPNPVQHEVNITLQSTEGVV